MHRFKLPIVCILLLSACSKHDTTALSSAKQATFVVDPVTVDVTDASADANFRGLTNARMFRFHACIKDVAVLQPVIGPKFAIYDGSKEIDEQSTDTSGCIYWSEKFSFPPTADEIFYQVNRSVTALTVHKGTVNLSFAVNPWRKDADAFRDLRFQPSPAGIRPEGSPATSSGTASLVVDTISAQLSFPEKGPVNPSMEIAFSTKMHRTSYNGQTLVDDLTEGTLSLRVQLVTFHGGAAEPISAPLEISKLDIDAGNIRWNGNIPLTSLPPHDSLVQLRFETKAVDAPSPLLPAQGRLDLGKMSGPVLSGWGALQSIDGSLFIATTDTAKPNPEVSPSGAWNFILGKVTIERTEILAVDGIGKPKIVEYQLLACLKNSLSLDFVSSEQFKISSADGNEVALTDPDSGCLRWKRKVDFDYATTPKPIQVKYDFTGQTGFYAGAHASRVLDFMPWQLDSGNGLIDEEFDGAPSPGAIADATPPQLILNSASYKFTGRTFEVDQNLNLGSVRRYRFSLSPMLRRMTQASGWLPPEAIANGRFLVRFLFETADLQNARVLDSEEVQADAIGGAIQTDVDFHFYDLAQVMGRIKVSIELRPLDKSVAVASVPVSDTMVPVRDGTLALVPSSESLDPRMSLSPKALLANASLPTQIFANSFGLKELPAGQADIGSAADAFATGDDSALSKLCGLFFTKNSGLFSYFSSFNKCVSDPKSYLVAARTEHMAKLGTATLVGSPETLNVSMSAGYSISDSDSNSHGSSYSIGADAKVSTEGKIPFLSLLGIDIGWGVSAGPSWSYSWSHEISKSKSQSWSSSISRSLSVDEASFDIQADVNHCFSVTAKGSTGADRYFHCAPQASPAEFKETYYFVHDDVSPSGIQDSDAPAGQRPFVALIRGADRFKELVTTLEDANMSLESSGRPAIPVELQKSMPAGSYDGLFPGLVLDAEIPTTSALTH